MHKIFVGNLSFATTEEMVKAALVPHVPVEEVILVRDEEGKCKGFGFVLTRDLEATRTGMRRLGKPIVDGRRVYLRESGEKRPKKVRRPFPRSRPPRAPRAGV